MTAVFLMQPLGQLMAQIVGLAVLLGYDNMYDLQHCTDPAICAPHIDIIWRWVTGVGAIPAVVAIIYRFLIKDPGLYDLDVKNQGDRGVKNTEDLYGKLNAAGTSPGPGMEMTHLNGATNGIPQVEPPLPEQFSWADINDYFIIQGNWRFLLGTSFCWFLLDV